MSFATMKTSVLRRARQSGTWATASVGEYLNECQKEMFHMPVDWKVLEDQDTASCVVGQSNYSVPSDFHRLLAFQLEDGSTVWKLLENSYDVVRTAISQASGTSSLPVGVAFQYQQLWLGPAPDKTYTMRLDYIKEPADMSADGDTTVFPEKLLIQYALSYFKKDLGRPEWKEEYQLYQEELDKYVQINDRGPDRLDGFAMGFDGASPYYSRSRMYGGGSYWRDFG